MLCTLLNSHPDVLCHHELFNPDGVFYALDLRDNSFDLGDVAERDRNPLAFLDRAWSKQRGHSHVGFKMTHRQNEAVLDAVLRDPGVRKIVLRRRNRIRTFVSRLISEKTGRWEAYGEAEPARERPRVQVDVAALRRSIAENDAYYDEVERSLEATGQPFLRVCYERLVEGGERTRLPEFLDLPHPDRAAATLGVRSVRQNPGDLRELIANYDELAGAVAGTPLAGDLADK